MSPLQLCVLGFMASDIIYHKPVNHTTRHNSENLELVEVPNNKLEPCDQLIARDQLNAHVQSAVDPVAQSDKDGKTLYYNIIHLVGLHLQGQCSRCKLN